MRDATTVTRTERALVELELLVGRLERVSALLEEFKPPAASSAPPLSPEAKELAEKVINRQLEEQKEKLEAAT